MSLKTLYKRNSSGSIQCWNIWVSGNEDNAIINIEYGVVDGKIQRTQEHISLGKNIGKSNETTALEQAKKQAQSMWNKKLDKNYVENLIDIDNFKNSKIKPMLAHNLKDKEHLLKQGETKVFYSPKLDGLRCIARKSNNNVKLWSRGGKPITSLPNIAEELNKIMENGEIWDGELYSHETSFNDITHIVRQEKELPEGYEKILYNIFDMISSSPFRDRYSHLKSKIKNSKLLKIVETYSETFSNENIEMYHDKFTKNKYEGVIIRVDNDSPYEQKRSTNLLKFKKFIDSEFKVVGFNLGKPGSKLNGLCANLVLEINIKGEIKTFEAKPDGPFETLKYIAENFDNYKGKMVTVKFQEYNEYGIPRFGVVKGIRVL